MKKVELPFTVGPKDVIHVETTFHKGGAVEHSYYLLNPVERLWGRIVMWWFWDWVANVKCVRCGQLLTLKDARFAYHPCGKCDDG